MKASGAKRPVETGRDAGIGNTKSPRRQDIQRIYWCFTLNNYDEEMIETIETYFEKNCVKYVFQEEIGEEGTPHLQGTIKLIKKTRFSELCKINEKIHWEKTNNIKAAFAYCQKDETHKGRRWSKGLPKPIKLIEKLKPWQEEIEKIVLSEPDDRTVYWYYDEIGGIGKSAFTKYMVAKYNVLPISEGKKSDIINIVYNYLEKHDEINCVIIDIPRDNGCKVSYKAIEDIKNGLIVNTKYETGCKVFNSPHVIVFANQEPEFMKLSADRWNIVNLQEHTARTNPGLVPGGPPEGGPASVMTPP